MISRLPFVGSHAWKNKSKQKYPNHFLTKIYCMGGVQESREMIEKTIVF